ncbi:hypothetical protein K0U00_28875, partial [Paenibacillus sepulcri]|nr:hypothetical protein [Paenibacillus sepulcri]
RRWSPAFRRRKPDPRTSSRFRHQITSKTRSTPPDVFQRCLPTVGVDYTISFTKEMIRFE